MRDEIMYNETSQATIRVVTRPFGSIAFFR